MTDIYYPHDYLPMPLQEGYGFQPVSPLKRTQLTTGRARQRRAYTSTPTQASVSWFMETDGQAQLFEAWYREKITDGADWFCMKLQTPLGVEFYKCRFTDIYEGQHWWRRFTGSSQRHSNSGNALCCLMDGSISLTSL